MYSPTVKQAALDFMAVCSPRLLRHESRHLLLMMNHVTVNKFIDHRGEILEKISFPLPPSNTVRLGCPSSWKPCAIFDYPNQHQFPDSNNYGCNELEAQIPPQQQTHFYDQLNLGHVCRRSVFVLGLGFSWHSCFFLDDFFTDGYAQQGENKDLFNCLEGRLGYMSRAKYNVKM